MAFEMYVFGSTETTSIGMPLFKSGVVTHPSDESYQL